MDLKPLSDFYYKKLGKLINDPYYDLNERYAPKLLDLGFIELKIHSLKILNIYMDSSIYVITEKGFVEYNKWKREIILKQNETNAREN